MKKFTFFERIRTQEHLTPSELRIVKHMERAFPVLALESVSTICEKAKVGRATVIRCIQKLGYESFSAFQQELRGELASRLNTPQERYEKRKAHYSEDKTNILHLSSEQIIENINELNSRIDYEQLLETARMLAKCPGRIYIMGNRSSYGLAFMLHFGLCYLRDDVILPILPGGMTSDIVSQISTDDILVLFFNRRYSSISEKMGRWFSEHGCPVILLTDREINPLTQIASKQFVIPSEGLVGLFDSRAATIAVIETIINLVTIELEHRIGKRLKRVEEAYESFEVFSNWQKKSS